MFLKRVSLAGLLVVLSLFVFGCSEEEGKKPLPETKAPSVSQEKPKAAEEEKPKAEAPKELDVTLYYPDVNGTKLFGVKRHVKIVNGDKYTAAVLALMEGPDSKEQTAVIPRRAKLLGVKVSDGVAKVNFSGELSKNFVGGSTGEEFLVGSLVNTLTEFKEIKAVQIVIDGQEVETLSGHMDLTGPIKRMDNLLK